jgi:hypothetical protein
VEFKLFLSILIKINNHYFFSVGKTPSDENTTHDLLPSDLKLLIYLDVTIEFLTEKK